MSTVEHPNVLTKDVDVIIQIGSYVEYTTVLRRQLYELHFREDTGPRAPLCRWLFEELRVDVMPTDGAVLGFSNRWYPIAMATAVEHALPNGPRVRVVSAPAFVATKLDAFYDRGKAQHALDNNLVAQYRTLASNSPSLALANRLGFERYATSLVIQMAPSGSSA